jgi:hypothetical protein
MSIQYITGSYSGIVLGQGDYASPFTVGSLAAIGIHAAFTTSSATGISASASYVASVVNHGYVYGSTNGIGLAGGGNVANAELNGIRSNGAGQIYGAIYGHVNGVLLGDGGSAHAIGMSIAGGGTVTNNGGVIKGIRGDGIRINGGYGSVYNSGTVRGDISDARTIGIGIYLEAGGTVTNSDVGVVGASDAGVIVAGGTSNLVANFGRIFGSHYAVSVQYGTVTNAVHGVIDADRVGVALQQGSLLNNGLIDVAYSGEYRPTGAAAVRLTGGGYISNGATGSIYVDSRIHGDGVLGASGVSTVENAGTISAYDGVVLESGGTVLNSGSIVGYGQYGVFINLGHQNADHPSQALGYISNASTGTIIGADAVYAEGTGSALPVLRLVNSGTIDGGAIGVSLYKTSTSLANAAGGTIEGSAGIELSKSDGVISNASGALISGGMGGAGIYARLSNLTLINSGIIVDPPADGQDGVQVLGKSFNGATYDLAAYITNLAGGTISGADGIYLTSATGSVSNAGHITGTNVGVSLLGGDLTLENTGTIIGTGGTAVYLNGTADRVIVEAGASFSGIVEVKAGDDGTLELTSGASAGTIHGLGAQYMGFGTVTIDAGANWTVAGTEAGFASVTVAGFNSQDRLDLTNLAFVNTDTAMVNGSDQLVIDDAGGNITIQMDGAVTGDLFTLVSDGHTGTFVEEDDYAPCYLRGTLILTAAGERPVEDLRIGDLLMTAGGNALPLKWIGRRYYRDWLAIGSADVQPILFKAGSIADGVPRRNLYVSPEHAMFIDGLLIPARHLANGKSIVKMTSMEEVDYFHLEFDRHVIVLAEGAEAESFVDDDSRMLFHNADEYRALYPNEPRGRHTPFCAPRVEAGAARDTIYRTLAARATRLRPDGTAASLQRRGQLDLATHRLVSGWAYSGRHAGPQALAILLNGAVVGRVVADRYRPDLKAAGIGDGCHGFIFTLPEGLALDAGERIEVRRETDWSLL